MRYLISFLLVSLAIWQARPDIWSVLVAGSDGWWNYRHQTDICHAYHTLVNGGVDPNKIIVFGEDDIANNPSNPIKGKLFNKHTPTGTPWDVYAGCKIDYKGNDVAVKLYIAVLKGDEATTKGHGTGRVLKSTSTDFVFLDFSDHGATGLIAFPREYMYADQLISTMKFMYDNKMYQKIVYYLEACESGSMFTSLPKTWNAYTTTASNDHESSWAFYCPPQDMVGTIHIGACLGDEYSISWMEDTDASDTTTETLELQYTKVRDRTKGSHVCQYGDMTWTSDKVQEFLGKHPPMKARNEEITRIDQRDVKLHYLKSKAQNDPAAQIALEREITSRKFYDQSFEYMTSKMGNFLKMDIADKYVCWDCYRKHIDYWEAKCGKFSEYGLKYARFLYGFCTTDDRHTDMLKNVIDTLC